MNPPKKQYDAEEAAREEKKEDEHRAAVHNQSKGREERTYQEELAEQLEEVAQNKAGVR